MKEVLHARRSSPSSVCVCELVLMSTKNENHVPFMHHPYLASHCSLFSDPLLHNSRLISINILLFSGDFVLWISSCLCQTIFVVKFVNVLTAASIHLNVWAQLQCEGGEIERLVQLLEVIASQISSSRSCKHHPAGLEWVQIKKEKVNEEGEAWAELKRRFELTCCSPDWSSYLQLRGFRLVETET